MPQTIEESLSGLWYEKDVIEIANRVLEQNDPNIEGTSWYTHNGVFLPQTALVLVFYRLHPKMQQESESRCNLFATREKIQAVEEYKNEQMALDLLAQSLLSQGVDISKNFYFKPPFRAEVSHVMSGFSMLLWQYPHLLHHVPADMYQKSMSTFLSTLNQNIHDNVEISNHCVVLEKLSCLPTESRVLTNYIFKLLVFRKESTHESAAQAALQLILQRLPPGHYKNILYRCINSGRLNYWINAYPKSVSLELLAVKMNHGIFSSGEYNAIYSSLLRNQLMHHLYALKKFDITGGLTEEIWPKTTKYLIDGKPSCSFLPKAPVSHCEFLSVKKDIHYRIENGHLQYYKILGRTILFKETGTGDITALKVQKKGEATASLEKEAQTLAWLRKKQQLPSPFTKRQNLQSKFPEPLGVEMSATTELFKLISSLDENILLPFTALITDTSDLSIYYYKVRREDEGYFTYLHDPSLTDVEFEEACRYAIHDLAKLLKEDNLVFHQLADIFHNRTNCTDRTDQGRYLILPALVRRSVFATTSGRVDQWKESVEYPNLRRTGLADVGDSDPFEEYKDSNFFQEITKPFTDTGTRQVYYSAASHAKEYIFANILAEYLFILTLIAGRRGVEQLKIDPLVQKEILWQRLAQTLINIAAQLVAEISDISEAASLSMIQGLIKVDVLALQMAYWMTTDYSKKLPTEEELKQLYPGAKIPLGFINKERYVSHEGLGFAADGVHQDLGGFNQQNPMKEDNKMYYFVVSLVRLFADMKEKYREASFACEDAITQNNLDSGKKALQQLEDNSYPHASWQKKNNERNRYRLFKMSLKRSDPIQSGPVNYSSNARRLMGDETQPNRDGSGRMTICA